MAEANIPYDLSSSFLQLRTKLINDIHSQCILIVFHDDEEILKNYKEIAADKLHFTSEKLYVFNDIDDCQGFLCQKGADNPDVQILVLAGGQSIQDLVKSIRYCNQVQKILILNKPPFDEKEREFMKACPKVVYVADESLDFIKTEISRLSESITLKLVCDEKSDENILSTTEPIDRTFKQLDKDFIFRYMLLLCLRNAHPSPSDKENFIKFLETNNVALSKEIEQFKEEYSSNQAILFYTRDVYIYSRLNTAIRTINIHYLLFYRFILQDICNQMYEQMIQDTSNQVLTLYRTQQSSELEIADLFLAYNRRTPVVVNSFFSTSKSQTVALNYLGHGDIKLDGMIYSQILFTIIASKQNASRFFPFANISKISKHPAEEEVLFVPGQMFNINKIEITLKEKGKDKEKIKVYSIEMTLKSEFDKSFDVVREKFSEMLEMHLNDSLLCLARLLIEYERFDEAKQLYQKLLLEYDDKKKKAACYEGLSSIASHEGNTTEMEVMHHKMNETKFGIEQPSNNSDGIPLSRAEADDFATNFNQILDFTSQLSLNQPVEDLFAFLDSDKYRNELERIINWQYTISTQLIKSGIYPIAAQYLELGLQTMKYQNVISFDPLIKARYFMQLGHCYRALKSNEEALNNYQLAMELKNHLPLDEYIDILTGIGAIMEVMNNNKEALDNYTEVAKILLANPTIGDLEMRRNNQESIQRGISNLIPLD